MPQLLLYFLVVAYLVFSAILVMFYITLTWSSLKTIQNTKQNHF